MSVSPIRFAGQPATMLPTNVKPSAPVVGRNAALANLTQGRDSYTFSSQSPTSVTTTEPASHKKSNLLKQFLGLGLVSGVLGATTKFAH
jgi:hypothetical protein